MLSDIYATASSSVGLPVHPDSDAIRMFRMVLAEGRSLIRQRNEIEERAVELLSDLPDYQLLTTIPGIGPINAMTILAEAGDLREPPPKKWSVLMIRKAEDQRWPLRDPSPKRLS